LSASSGATERHPMQDGFGAHIGTDRRFGAG
jgi:hypothetical protein